ncbi:MAG: PqqD family protein [Candidatus Omnitrophica bacterium]|nr:PqqD family protein [Candidatus Omnitrophota bacterium]MBU0878942.1 PqqD family protein [Candidatus Omnitrophota bacterium]MBU1133947.1 PqqD family protein [Candidatus Omnitrophota bacterium]MBU1523193.1 PqqD family protein [Candidatus Omnitrophota bacterium]MBU1809718.1 PqqD family protein [Candidatus Omnitrophota bacterium]
MKAQVDLNSIYKPSKDVVAREVQGEFILIPITSGIGDLEDEIFSLNETGRAVWDKLDGKKNLKNIAEELTEEFQESFPQIEKDCLGILSELLNRKMIVEA